jgi:hypothetical protein
MKRIGFKGLGCRAFAATWVIILGFVNQNVVIGAFLCAFAKERLLASSCLSVCPSAWNIPAPTGRIFMKFDILGFFQKHVLKNSSFIKIGQE